MPLVDPVTSAVSLKHHSNDSLWREAVAGHCGNCNRNDGRALNRQQQEVFMRFGDSPESENFEDRTGQSGGGGMNLGGGLGMILPLVASRFASSVC
jgi:hypothetical protein